MVIVLGWMNERLRNVVHAIPAEVFGEAVGASELPVDAGRARGLLSFPHESGWVFYNTNPGALTVELRRKSAGTLITPGGTRVPVQKGTAKVTMEHGAWLELAD